MSNQIYVLINMQKIDDKITEKEALKNNLPLQLDQLITSVQKAEDLVNTISNYIEENLQNQKAKETEIKTNNEIKLKYGHQLDGIKTNKEYKALNSQIAILTDKNAIIEEEILSIMDEETNQRKLLADAIIKKKHAEENLKANEDLLKSEIEKVNIEIEELKEKRSEFAKLIPLPMVKKYVQLIKNKNHKAVVYCNHDACSGCGFHIRPQILIELNDINKTIYCENCGRIIVKSFDV